MSQQRKIHSTTEIHNTTDTRKLFSTFKYLLNLSPLATNLTAEPYASFFTDKVAANSRQFSEPSTGNLSSLTTFEKLLKTQLFLEWLLS